VLFNFYCSNVAAFGANEGLQGGKGSKFRRCSHKCHQPTAHFARRLANIFWVFRHGRPRRPLQRKSKISSADCQAAKFWMERNEKCACANYSHSEHIATGAR